MTKKDKLRLWHLPEKFQWQNLRYKNPFQKGIYWFWFSLQVRTADVEAWGTCISCGRPITLENCDAGHFIPAARCGRDLLFDLRNVNAECKYCNGFDELHLFGYSDGLDRRYGAGTAAELRRRHGEYKASSPQRDWTAKEYEAKIKALPAYQTALREMADTKT